MEDGGGRLKTGYHRPETEDHRLETGMRDYTKIVAWRKADDLAVAVNPINWTLDVVSGM